jgi:spore coat polysaccharide biosynthesis protein SpsF (cytidylyltransferase family)
MKTIAIVQARTRSTRFPRKVLADLCGHPVLWHVVTRAKAIQGVDKVVVACPESDGETIRDLDMGVDVVAYTKGGDENDVLSRFEFVSHAFPAGWYVRLTADCPMLNPEVAQRVLDAAVDGQCYAHNDCVLSGYPDGWDAQAFPAELLRRAADKAWSAYDREHVCPWMERHAKVVMVMNPDRGAREWLKMSVDTAEDLERVRAALAGENNS